MVWEIGTEIQKTGEEQVWEENQDFGFEHIKLRCVGSSQQSHPINGYLSLWFWGEIQVNDKNTRAAYGATDQINYLGSEL